MSGDLMQKMVEKIRQNRISTTEVADCLGKTGALPGVSPLNPRHFRVGPVFFAYAYNDSNWELHQQLEQVRPGDIVVIDIPDGSQKAIFGSLVTKYIMLYKQASAVVLNGYARDGHTLVKENYPVWCKGLSPVGFFNRKNEDPVDQHWLKQRKEHFEGAIAVCDDSGVVVIPKAHVTDEFMLKLDFIELQEDIWFYCIDVKKWSTYDTVCLKKYLDLDLLPHEFREKFKQFVKKTEEG